MPILRTIPSGHLTLGGSKITVPVYVMPPGEEPPVHFWISYRGGKLWTAHLGRKTVDVSSFKAALAEMPEGRRVVMGATEGLLSSETAPKTPAPVTPPPVPEEEETKETEETEDKTLVEHFDPEEGQDVTVMDQSSGDSFPGKVVEAESRSMDVEYDGKTNTFTKRTNDTWIKKGSSADSGLQVLLVVD